MSPGVVCTISATNHLALVAVLVETLRATNPDLDVVALVVDGGPGQDVPDMDATVLVPYDLGIDRAEVHRMAACYTVFELCTALKPYLLRHLLAEREGPVLYLDSDIEVHGSLEPLYEATLSSGLALTPHVLGPFPRDGRLMDESSLLTSGQFNLGFVGVTDAAAAFVDWWAARTARDALVDPVAGQFTDQKWVDLVPTLFEHTVVRDPGSNVAYWNLHERELTVTPEGAYRVEGGPLRFFHFSGFDPNQPWRLSSHQGDRPRVLLAGRPALQVLCRQRARALLAHDHDGWLAVPYGWGRAGDVPMDGRIRRRYRDALLAAEASGTEPPPDPYATDPEPWRRWLTEPVGGSLAAPRSRWVDVVWESRVDLRVSFPDPDGTDAERLLEWAAREAVDAGWPDLLHPVPGPAPDPPARVPGCNVLGFLGLDRGVGEAARALGLAVRASGLPVCELDFPNPGLAPGRRPLHVEPGPYDVNLLAVNPSEMILAHRSAAHREAMAARYSIGLWFWEVDRFAPEFEHAFDLVDEIWVASRYNEELFRSWTDRPVHLFPLPIEVPPPTNLTRADLGLPEGFLFGYVYDHLSLLERKNPLGLVEAWCRAFEPGDGPTLVLKSVNGAQRPIERDRVRVAVEDRPDIVLIEGSWTGSEMRALYQHLDAYVSLHRSEGFGLTMATSMALGRPVVATGHSANLDFMHAGNSYLVPWRPVPVGSGSWPYPPDATWADPDLDEAAALLRRVVERPEEAAAKGARAAEDIADRYGLARSARFVLDRLREQW